MFARSENRLPSVSPSTSVSPSESRPTAVSESVRPQEVSAFGPSAKQVADSDGRRFISTLIASLEGAKGREFSSQELQAAYGEWCAEQNRDPRAWSTVAAAISKLIRKRGRPLKTYRRYVDRHGKDRRRRVFEIPFQMPS